MLPLPLLFTGGMNVAGGCNVGTPVPETVMVVAGALEATARSAVRALGAIGTKVTWIAHTAPGTILTQSCVAEKSPRLLVMPEMVRLAVPVFVTVCATGAVG